MRYLILFVVSFALPVLFTGTGFPAMEPVSGEFQDSALVSVSRVLTDFDGLLIDSIIIDNRTIFDTDDPAYSGFVFSLANKLHAVTRQSVIRREVLLEPGAPFSSELAAETARNLRSRYHLYDAWIEAEHMPGGTVRVTVVTIDVWSIVGGLTVKTDGGETDATVGFEERNLLGFNQFLQLEYTFRERWDDYFLAVFRDPRLAGKPVSVGVEVNTDSFDDRRQLSVSKPFYNLQQRFSYRLELVDSRARREYFEDDRLIAESRSDGQFVTVGSALRFGNLRRKIGPDIEYEYRYKRTYDKTLLGADPVVFPEDSTLHRVKIGLSAENVDFVAAHRINGFGYTEDFTTGQAASLGVRRAFLPGFGDHAYDQVTFDVSVGWRFRNNLFLLTSNNAVTFRGPSERRRVTELALRYYYNRIRWMTIAGRAGFVRDWQVDDAARLVLGGKSGLRGYPTEYRTGDRLAVCNVEGRFFPGLELWSVLFGGTIFMDIGRTFKPDESLSFTDFDIAVGIGCRVSFEKSSRSRILRLDLSRNRVGEWQVSIGSGQYF